eukprot:TRINITY_DN1233_c0_g1_i1.p1 TRINITY_DN1233_c0_g1~~TRINITY_DN1233_c0_g1_i1.p1  ORF type:complete len:113 (-),score=13.96 TRINITY_DN1233_c0_g1_i1:274-612(-)
MEDLNSEEMELDVPTSPLCIEEILLHIFSYLDFKTLGGVVSLVCKHWRFASRDERLWKLMYSKRWTPVVELCWFSAYAVRHVLSKKEERKRDSIIQKHTGLVIIVGIFSHFK